MMDVHAANHAALSLANARFLEYARDNAMRRLPLLDADLPMFLQQHPFGLSSWPIFIGPDTIAELSACAERIPGMLLRCFDRGRSHYFERIQQVCHFDETLIRRFFAFDVTRQVVSRLDMTGTEDGFKLLEINSGSDLGGWEMTFFDHQYRKQEPLRRFMQTLPSVSSRNILKTYVQSLIEACLGLGFGADKRLNFLYVVEPVTLEKLSAPMAEALIRFGAELGYELVVRFETDLSAVHPHEDGIGIDGQRIHGYFPVVTDVKAPVNATIFDVFCNGRLLWPDNPVSACLNDKALLADLHWAQDSDEFDAREKAIIRRHIAWGCRLTETSVRYDDTNWDLRRLLAANKDAFVIKPVVGGQGRDVFVGRCLNAEQWRQVLDHAFQAPQKWLAQHFCESRRYYTLGPDESLAVAEYVWGVFSYSGRYGGAWVRLKTMDGNPTGVINSHTGAQETIVYEVRE